MTTTALFIERDPSYVAIVRKLRGTMTREEWQHPGHRAAAIRTAWARALAHIRQSDATAEFISPLPVTLYLSPLSATVVVADIRRDDSGPIWITPTGRNLIVPPPLDHMVIRRTTYATWAEGPLPHIEPDLLAAPTPKDDPEVQRIRAQNASLREAIDRAMASPANWSPLPRQYFPESSRELIDFRVRGVFRVRDFAVLESKQSASAKLRTAEGMLDIGENGVAQ